MELISSYRKKGREEGRREGKLEGRLEGKKDSICTFLETKFGAASSSVQEEIGSVDDVALLDTILKKTFAAESLEVVEKVIEEMVKK